MRDVGDRPDQHAWFGNEGRAGSSGVMHARRWDGQNPDGFSHSLNKVKPAGSTGTHPVAGGIASGMNVFTWAGSVMGTRRAFGEWQAPFKFRVSSEAEKAMHRALVAKTKSNPNQDRNDHLNNILTFYADMG